METDTDTPQPWHRLFGLAWINLLQGTSYEVQTEVDLSVRKQLLDLVLIRKGTEPLPFRLPDGFEDLAAHNLVTFKSYQEALDRRALRELIAHFVNYQKQSSPSMNDLLPESEYRLFAVCARFPQNLARQEPLAKLQDGVYVLEVLGLSIRIVVAHELPEEQHNAMLLLFSARAELLTYAEANYQPRSQETSTLLLRLFRTYFKDPNMPDKLKEFVRETIDELLQTLSAEERLKGLPAEERLKGLPAEERLKGLPAEERLKGLPAEERLKGLPAEERLKGLSAEEVLKGLPAETLEMLETLVRQHKPNGSRSNTQ